MEKVYNSLTTHLESLLDNANLVNYEVVSLGNPQSTGIIKCFRINQNNNVVISQIGFECL